MREDRFTMNLNIKPVLLGCLLALPLVIFSGACDTLNGGQRVPADTAFDRTGTLRSDGVYTSMLTNNYAVAGGEGDSNKADRAFVSVVLNQVPAGANVTQAILTLKASAPEGDPFGDFGNMTVDHVNVVSSINAASFNAAPLTAGIATITSLPAGLATETLELDVTAQVQADLAAGRPISSFRFQFNSAPNMDGSFDQVFIHANQNDIDLRPTAEITIAQ
jgi:hypothetical protein